MYRNNRRLMFALAAAGVVLWPVSGAWASDDVNACAMLQQGDVEAAFAPRKFDSGKLGVSLKATQTRAAVSSCTYTSKGATINDMVTVTLNVRHATSDAIGTTAEAAKAGAVHLNAAPVDVAGLGDGAYMINYGSNIQLNVFRGKREWLVFGSRAKKLDDKAILAGLTRIAKATLARQ